MWTLDKLMFPHQEGKKKWGWKKEKEGKPWILRFSKVWVTISIACYMGHANVQYRYHVAWYQLPKFNINVQCWLFPHVPPNYVYLLACRSHFYIHKAYPLFPPFSFYYTHNSFAVFLALPCIESQKRNMFIFFLSWDRKSVV